MNCETISFYTFGCRLNQSETSSISNSFNGSKIRVVDFDTPADVVVINTCTVTENGDNDARRLINRICRINPESKIALVGCQAQIQKEKLSSLPNVRWIIGNSQKQDFLNILKSSNDNDQCEIITPAIDRKSFVIPHLSVDKSHARANLKVQDGCDFFCSFCEIPYARGRARSREYGDLLREANALADIKHKELVITGINVGTYSYENKNLVDVINGLELIENLFRIRISSIEPTTINDEIITCMANRGKLCRHLHIPLQSGCDKILVEMKRKYTTVEFSRYIKNVYSKVEQICIGTDVIVGFPGETDKEFEETFDFLRSNPINYFHVFSYSKRNLAKSKDRIDPVDVGIVKKRSRILRELSLLKREKFHSALLGTTQYVLFEECRDGFYNGLTDNYCRVYVKSSASLINEFLPVSIVKLVDGHLMGEIKRN